jgi:AcrR family transcriptional regulator
MQLTENEQPTKLKRSSPGNSRDKVIRAGKKVFSKHPYHTATLRMVGKEAGINHQSIAHYFPSKADLFEAVTSEAFGDFYRAFQGWVEGLNRVGIDEDFRLFVECLIEYHSKNPEPLRIMALNAPMIERLDELPGFQHTIEVRSKTRATFMKSLPSSIDQEMLERFTTTFDTAILSYLGAAVSQAGVLGMDAASEEYMTWVKETLICLFTPMLKSLLSPE